MDHSHRGPGRWSERRLCSVEIPRKRWVTNLGLEPRTDLRRPPLVPFRKGKGPLDGWCSPGESRKSFLQVKKCTP